MTHFEVLAQWISGRVKLWSSLLRRPERGRDCRCAQRFSRHRHARLAIGKVWLYRELSKEIEKKIKWFPTFNFDF
jgi:hypothetical protein